MWLKCHDSNKEQFAFNRCSEIINSDFVRRIAILRRESELSKTGEFFCPAIFPLDYDADDMYHKHYPFVFPNACFETYEQAVAYLEKLCDALNGKLKKTDAEKI